MCGWGAEYIESHACAACVVRCKKPEAARGPAVQGEGEREHSEGAWLLCSSSQVQIVINQWWAIYWSGICNIAVVEVARIILTERWKPLLCCDLQAIIKCNYIKIKKILCKKAAVQSPAQTISTRNCSYLFTDYQNQKRKEINVYVNNVYVACPHIKHRGRCT